MCSSGCTHTKFFGPQAMGCKARRGHKLRRVRADLDQTVTPKGGHGCRRYPLWSWVAADVIIRRHLRRRLEHFRARLPCPGPIPGHPVPSEARRARGRGAGPIGALASWCAHGCIMVDLLCPLLPGPVPNRPKPPRKLRLRGARVTAWRRRRKGVAVMNSKQ